MALLCLVVCKACMCCRLQVSNTCNQMSSLGELQMEHVMDGYKSVPKNNCLQALPMYWLSLGGM
jgi:hypothetical protein